MLPNTMRGGIAVNRGMLCLSLTVATLVAVGLWQYVIEPWTEAQA